MRDGRIGLAALLAVAGMLAGCAVVPKVADQDYATCRVATRQLDVAMIQSGGSYHLHCGSGEECLAALAVVAAVPVATGVVSGSIVVVNNTVHWMEYQGRCSDSELRRALSSVNDALLAAGGMVIETGQQMWHWLTAWWPGAAEEGMSPP